jgi:hypothetical protein
MLNATKQRVNIYCKQVAMLLRMVLNSWFSEGVQRDFRNENLAFVACKSCYIYTLSKI